MGIYIVAKFGTDWSIFADARVRVQRISEFRPAGRVPSKRYASYFDFHSSIFQSIQTARVSKQSFPPSDFGRLLELMQF